MISENLEQFMEHIDFKTKEVAEYQNKEKGLLYPLSVPQLLTRVDYLELTKEELEKAKFEQKVDKKDYKMYDCKKIAPKSSVTKDKKDNFTLIEKQVKATHIYNVTNQVGIHTTFEDVEDAFKLCEEINSKVYEVLK